MKFEYALLKERTKNLIVKDYLESEIQAALADKQELISERQRYGLLNEMERAILDEKKALDLQK